MKFVLCFFCLLFFSIKLAAEIAHIPRAYIMLDAQDYENIGLIDERHEHVYLRRIRLSVDSQFNEKLKTQLEIGNNDDDEFTLKDAYIKFKDESFGIKLGWQKHGFGLENSMNLKNLASIERTVASSHFHLGRHPGIRLSFSPAQLHFNVGYFDGSDDNDTVSGVYSRLSFHIPYENGLVHIGGNAAYRDWRLGNYRVKENPELYHTKNIILGPKLQADAVNQKSLELAWQHQNVLLMAEYMYQEVEVENVDLQQNSDYEGYYVQASFLTDHAYRYKISRFTRVNMKKNQQALEFVARYSYMDALDNYSGTLADLYLVGMNYYWGKSLKLLLQYQQSLIERPTTDFLQEPRAVTFRFQYTLR